MRKDVEFQTRDGLTLRGWLYTPDDASGESPCIIVAHGFTATKYMSLDKYGEAFSKAGFAALVYDHRNFGDSDGEPRGEVSPHDQRSDYRDAISFAETLPEVDAERIGIWGTSYSAGLVVEVGAIDRRAKAVVAQAPLASGYWNVRRLGPEGGWPDMLNMLAENRRAEFAGAEPGRIPVVSDDPLTPHAIAGINSWNYFTSYPDAKWENSTTLRSVDYFLEYDPGPFFARVSPTPLLMIVATEDMTTPTDLSLECYESALEPKELVLIKGHHYGSYVDEFAQSSQVAIDFYKKWL
ncbi:MAG: alpha/beta hydrolase [Gordonia sp. (in: high G+C Gram-positive bacteria)]